MEKDYSSLFERIRQRCRDRNCYGSDDEYIDMGRRRFLEWKGGGSEIANEEIYYDAKGNEHKVDRRKQLKQRWKREQRLALLRTRFAYPPATKAQLDATEKALGFALPSALQALYTQVANGGFGPSFGIIGAEGGHPSLGEDVGKNIAEVYHKSNRYLRFSDRTLYEEQLAVEKELFYPNRMFPAFFLLLCDQGCGNKIYIDAITGLIFREDDTSLKIHISCEANSLEEWLEAWLFKP